MGEPPAGVPLVAASLLVVYFTKFAHHGYQYEIASFGLFKRSVRAGFIEEYMDYVSCGNPTCHQCH